MPTLKQVKQTIKDDSTNWSIHLTDFVDDFRYYRDQRMIEEPFELDDERLDALLAATAEQLCGEAKGVESPFTGYVDPLDAPPFGGW